MGDEPRLLRPDVIIEPLIDGFYAWPQTVVPVQSAMNPAFWPAPLPESYLQSPRVHIAASGNPEMRNGHFINLDEGRDGEIRALRSLVKRDRADLLRFTEAVAESEKIVRQRAAGSDLTQLYPKLPAELTGSLDVSAFARGDDARRTLSCSG